ncbi:MAG TPA: ribbon-helix-helix protein, CopG family [Candidatus Dormibacteraeota bacterium]|nr:ribbon-helix-helix protein, CopG family [Candidatus Dormibacteraeota bacterium]
MPRTTLNLDASLLAQLKQRQRRQRTSLSELVNQLLSQALAETETAGRMARPLRWTARAMGARVDLEDKDALAQVLDGR